MIPTPIEDTLAAFCAGLAVARRISGRRLEPLARELGYSRAQFCAILAGRVKRPPDWSGFVEPLLTACGATAEDLRVWRHQHHVMTLAHAVQRPPPLGPAPPASPGSAAQRADLMPAPRRGFVGRTDERRALSAAVPDDGSSAVVVVSGPPGVGKTATTLAWARDVGERFPSGRLFVDLRGYDLDAPLDTDDALAHLLLTMGVPHQDLADSAHGRAAQFRQLTSGGGWLAVLDNASSAEQVRPLLLASAGSLTVVTSRSPLDGLVARDCARLVPLGPLSTIDALTLLREELGEQVDDDFDAALAIARRCGGLPLALRVASSRVGAGRLPTLKAVLRSIEERGALVMLAADDPRSGVETVIAWSVDRLAEPDRDAFVCLGAHPCARFSPGAVSALLGPMSGGPAAALDRLAVAGLLEPLADGGALLHDLVHQVAVARFRAGSLTGANAAAEQRLTDYLAVGFAALFAGVVPSASGDIARYCASIAGGAKAVDAGWLDAEHEVAVWLAQRVLREGDPVAALRLATPLVGVLDSAGRFRACESALAVAQTAARSLGQHGLLADLALFRGTMAWRQGRYDAAAGCFTRSAELYRAIGDSAGTVRAGAMVANVHARLGRLREAAEVLQEALHDLAELPDATLLVGARDNLGIVLRELGRYEEALLEHEAGAEVVRRYGLDQYSARVRIGRASVLRRLGRFDEARPELESAAADARRREQRDWLASAEIELAHCYAAQGDPRAEQFADRAAAYGLESGDAGVAAAALLALGEVRTTLGRAADAEPTLCAALERFEDLGDEGATAETLNRLGECRLAQSRPDDARADFRRALEVARLRGMEHEVDRAAAGLNACGPVVLAVDDMLARQTRGA